MKLVTILFLILFISTNRNFAQEVKDSITSDSVKINQKIQLGNYNFSSNGSKINLEDFNMGIAISPLQLIQGKVPGFIINNLNGNDPNPNLQIQSRGTSTLYLSTEPLYIVDGIPMSSPDIVPTENIETIEVLKSISETAPYGLQGANGVVLISTRKSESKSLKVIYSNKVYMETFAKKSDYLSATDWRRIKQYWSSSPYNILTNQSAEMTDYNGNTDWRKEISQNKLSQVHHLGASGGYKKTSYQAMINYNQYHGILQKTNNTTYNGQVSISQLALNDKLQLTLTLTGTAKKYSQINDNPYLVTKDPVTGLISSNIISTANLYNPTQNVYNPDGSYGIDTVMFPNPNFNPVNLLNITKDNRKLNNMLVHLCANYEILKGLKFSLSYSVHRIFTNNSFSEHYQYFGYTSISGESELNDQKDKLLTANLDYNKSIDGHHFELNVNYSNQRKENNYNYQDSVITSNWGIQSKSSTKANSYFNIVDISTLLKYNYRNKYYLSLGLVKEISPLNNIHSTSDYDPSLSAAWSLGNEELLKDIAWISEIKIRANYGVCKRPLIFDNNFVMGTFNPNLHAEKITENNYGVDINLFSNRIYFSVDYYQRNTKDGLDYWFTYNNDVTIQNKGWEFYLKCIPIIAPFKWTFTFTSSVNKNIILSDVYTKQGWNIKNQAVGNFYGYQFAGYSNTDETLFVGVDGKITTNPETKLIGNGSPKSFLGISQNFDYKNISLAIGIRGAFNFNIKNLTNVSNYREMNFKQTVLTTDQRNIMNMWLPYSDYTIEKGDYIKIDNITLGYTLHLEKHLIKNAKVFIGCTNVALLTKFTGGNPEAAGITGMNPGVFYGEKYPNSRIFSLGLKMIL